MPQQSGQVVYLFCAYAPQDEHFYRELEKQFSVLSWQGVCTLRHMGNVAAGSELEQGLSSLIDQAGLVLVLLSPDYFASVFYLKTALRELLVRKAEQGCLVPVLLRPCAWRDSPLGIFMPLPRDGSTVSGYEQRDTVWLAIVEELRPRIVSVAAASINLPARMAKGNGDVWFLPSQRNPFFTGRDQLMTVLRERLQVGDVPGQVRILAIGGLGGIGKTQVVLEYAYRSRQDYSTVLWVTAETQEMLLADFTRLGELLGFSAYVGREPGEMVSLVKDWLNQHDNWLLIFDNVDTAELVRDYLPVTSRSSGHILLTTRATTLGGLAEVIQVEEMRGQEGELLLLRRSGLIKAETFLEEVSEQIRRDAAQIVGELGGLPLGIDQAGAYMAETGCGPARYLSYFQRCRTRLLAQRGKLPPGHPEPVATTWTLSFQRFKKTLSGDLLMLCAFLAPDNIPEALFLKGASGLGPRLAQLAVDPLALDTALAELRHSSLIKRNAESNTISLHRLVQVVLRDTLKPAQKQMWTERAMSALSKMVPEPDAAPWQERQLYLPHVSACVQLIDEYHFASEKAGELLNRAGEMLKYYALYSEAEKMYERALQIYEQALGPEHLVAAMVLDNQATLLGIQRKYEQAVDLYRRALSIRERVLGSDHLETASTIYGLALLYSHWHRYEESEQCYERALSIREHALGPEHPETATILDNLAVLYARQKKYEQAESLFKRALQIREGSLGLEHPMTASTLNNLAVLYRVQERYEQAKALFERILLIHERTLGPDHPAVATTINNLAYLARLQGQYERALLLYERALRMREHAFGSEHPNATITCLNVGELYLEMGEYEQAERFIRRALVTHEQAWGREHPRVMLILGVYARLLQRLGRDEEARGLEERVRAVGRE